MKRNLGPCEPQANMLLVKTRDSLLTTSSGYTNYRGILNLVIILLVLSNARAALENIIKYGILVDPVSCIQFLCQGQKHWPALLICASQMVHALLALGIELVVELLTRNNKWSAGKPVGRGTLFRCAHLALVANLGGCLALPPLLIYTYDTHPFSASAALMLVSIVFLKLTSYHMMNFWCRDSRLPEQCQARTTRSFLAHYTPPELEFELLTKPSDARMKVAAATAAAASSSSSSGGSPTPTASGDSALSSDLDASPGSETTRLRNRRVASVVAAAAAAAAAASTSTFTPDLPPRKLDQAKLREQKVRAALAKYPNNLCLSDMLAYLSYPTLSYELEFARTARIRKHFLLKRLVELVILSQLDIALIQQWIVPTVSNSLLPLRQMQLSHMLERLLKLAVPNHVIWLIWFYMFFHSLLNILAELTRFADREFYRDWWNSESVYYFWSNWNLPVHKWCVRHLYLPALALGVTKCQAKTAVFLVSAFFHEYLVSVPLKMFRMWAFTGMLMQLPMARFVSIYFNQNFANVAVWMSLIIGQPLCILMYYHDYYVINSQPLKSPLTAQ